MLQRLYCDSVFTNGVEMIRKTITAIKNYFTDTKQEPETIFKPLVKMPVEKLEEIKANRDRAEKEFEEISNQWNKPKEEITPPVLYDEDPFQSNYKTEKIRVRAAYMNPFVREAMYEMIDWADDELNIHAIITETVSTLEEDKLLKRVSSTHREGRAFDMRTLKWKPEEIEKFTKFFNDKYGHLGAITTSGKPLLILHHDSGHGDHFHIQFSKTYDNSQNIKGKLV